MIRFSPSFSFQKNTSYRSGRKVKGGDKGKGEEFPLPPPEIERGRNIFEVIKERRSKRVMGGSSNIKELSTVLWSANGVTMKKKYVSLRSAPSAGALYSVENYISVQRVEGIEKGIYFYEPEKHCLRLLKKGDFSDALQRACLDQRFVGEAAFNLIWTANFDTFLPHYGDRGLRYAYLDAGHIAENAFLACVSLGLSACPVGAYFDDEINSILELEETNPVIYLLSAGRTPHGADGSF